MAKAKMWRWVCPNGCAGVLAPSRPRADDVRRYCLKCSARTGRLVSRNCPALDRQRELRVDDRKEREARRREREAQRLTERHLVDGMDVRAEWGRLCALPRVQRALRDEGLRRIELTVSWSKSKQYTTGRSFGGRVHLGLYEGCPRYEARVLMLHELAHEMCRRGVSHGEMWRRVFARLVCEAYTGGQPEELRPREGTVHEFDGRVERAVRQWEGGVSLSQREQWLARHELRFEEVASV